MDASLLMLVVRSAGKSSTMPAAYQLLGKGHAKPADRLAKSPERPRRALERALL
ncbi:hypothetical protein [Trinickia symbiotica]|nr:hypothetical protein [Trinickia symbiotica]